MAHTGFLVDFYWPALLYTTDTPSSSKHLCCCYNHHQRRHSATGAEHPCTLLLGSEEHKAWLLFTRPFLRAASAVRNLERWGNVSPQTKSRLVTVPHKSNGSPGTEFLSCNTTHRTQRHASRTPALPPGTQGSGGDVKLWRRLQPWVTVLRLWSTSVCPLPASKKPRQPSLSVYKMGKIPSASQQGWDHGAEREMPRV